MSIVNPNPKGDALLVLSILVTNCREEDFTKNWLLDKLAEISKTKDPHKLLTGAAYAHYLRAKDARHFTKPQGDN